MKPSCTFAAVRSQQVSAFTIVLARHAGALVNLLLAVCPRPPSTACATVCVDTIGAAATVCTWHAAALINRLVTYVSTEAYVAYALKSAGKLCAVALGLAWM